MTSLRPTYLSCALLALSAIPAFSTPTMFSDRSLWMSTLYSSTTITFDGLGSPVNGNYNTAAGFTTGLPLTDNPTFVGTINGGSGYALLILDSTLSTWNNFGSGNSLEWAALSGTIITSSALQVTFPTPVTAFGVDLMTSGGSGLTYNVKLNTDPQVYTAYPTSGWPNRTFFGMVSDVPFSSITFNLPAGSSGVTPLIDNFSYSTGETPEPRTFVTIASGLIVTALLRGRARRRRAAQLA